MELHPTPFPVKSKYMRSKSIRKISEERKPDAKIGPSLRQKRVFGTSRNPNIPSKPAAQKPKPKLLEKPSETSESSDKNEANPRKKSVCFQENEADRNGKFSGDGDVINEPQTPVKPGLVQEKPRLSATPYRTADKCSKCRFDRLETSAYWLGQIKLAESVGKHFVSANFFRLAFDCKAEPFRNLKVELKKYVTRHEYLNEEEEWRKLSISYGLAKHETISRDEKLKAVLIGEDAVAHGQEDQEQQKQNVEED